DWEWGSGSSLLHLLNSFPADSPFITETPGKPVNCTQRFWLPPSSAICWENIAGPEEFAESRLLVLQNRAALQAVSTSSGVEEGGISYDHQAREEVQGIRSDHLSVVDTMQTMEKVFVSLEEKRKEGKEMKERLANTRDTIGVREDMANHLEEQFSTLEKTLLNIQLRLNKLIQQ
uniref:Si:ch211-57n23.1 n=1 Tax=Seriola lalandi dorsalis TaxID=1841481 RepID=A0A3B4XJ30_SERLL